MKATHTAVLRVACVRVRVEQVYSFDLRKPDVIFKAFETEYAHNQDEVNSVRFPSRSPCVDVLY
jgi:hypothetical protein